MPRRVEVMAGEAPEDVGGACEALLLFWYHGEGDTVVADEDLAEIETAKAVVVVKAPATGTLCDVLVREGDAVEAGQKLAEIECA